MKVDEHQKILDSIKTEKDETKKIELLIKLKDDYAKVSADLGQAQKTAQEQTERANSYADLNSKLWVQNGTTKKETETETENETETEPTKKTYDDLTDKIFSDK